MNEDKNTEFDSGKDLLDDMKSHYPEHETLPPQQRLTNDIRTNIQKIGFRIYIWNRKGATEDKLDELAQKGLEKLRTLYSNGTEYQTTADILKETINENNMERKQTGKPTIIQEVLGRNISAFTTEEKGK